MTKIFLTLKKAFFRSKILKYPLVVQNYMKCVQVNLGSRCNTTDPDPPGFQKNLMSAINIKFAKKKDIKKVIASYYRQISGILK